MINGKGQIIDADGDSVEVRWYNGIMVPMAAKDYDYTLLNFCLCFVIFCLVVGGILFPELFWLFIIAGFVYIG